MKYDRNESFAYHYKSSLARLNCIYTLEFVTVQETPISTDDMRVLELNAEYLGVTLGMLMQNAGLQVAETIIRNETIAGKFVVILCGGGGNGGDGMVAARHLQEAGANVELYLVGSDRHISSPDTFENWSILQNLHELVAKELKSETSIKKCKSIQQADILIDALLGFGLKSTVREPIRTAIREFNKSKARKYAIDIPSGIDSDTGKIHGVAVKADSTITLHAPKPGLMKAKGHVGNLYTKPIGIPTEASRICGPGDMWRFTRPRKKTAHKGDAGHVLIIGGSDVFSGAPGLAGMAALRTGVDLVTVMSPEPVVEAIRCYDPNLIVRSLGTDVLKEDSVETVLEIADGFDAIALGPGLGVDIDTKLAVQDIVCGLVSKKTNLVIDADGLKNLAEPTVTLDPRSSVLTPHWGELQVLLGTELGEPENLEDRIIGTEKAAEMYHSTTLLKGSIDVIANSDGNRKLNRTGVPAMTVGGTGDVLTGIVAALLAQRKGAFEAASAAAFISGLAGELAFNDFGEHITATDCVSKIPHVMKV
jgi:NAD(P)H-hydrate epimerase